MNDMMERVKVVRESLDEAKGEVNRLKGQKDQLNTQKKKILADFKELGVEPKEAKKVLEKLESNIEGWLADAENSIRDFEDTRAGE